MSEPPRKKAKKAEVKEDRLVVVLEQASLEVAKIGNKFELLSSEKHRNFLLKQKKDPAAYRPDITHQCLLMLLDSPLNRAGRLQVFVHTTANVLIQLSPQLRVPRTFDRFAGLIVQLLHKLAIRAADSSHKLMKVVRNPVSAHLPVGCRRLGTSFHAEGGIASVDDLTGGEEGPVAVVVGALARGVVRTDYTERDVKLSNYPLSAATACAKLTGLFEAHWDVESQAPVS